MKVYYIQDTSYDQQDTIGPVFSTFEKAEAHVRSVHGGELVEEGGEGPWAGVMTNDPESGRFTIGWFGEPWSVRIIPIEVDELA